MSQPNLWFLPVHSFRTGAMGAASSGLPCALSLEEGDVMQASGVLRREIAMCCPAVCQCEPRSP